MTKRTRLVLIVLVLIVLAHMAWPKGHGCPVMNTVRKVA